MAKTKNKKKQTDDVGATEGAATHALDERNQRVADILQALVDDGYLEDWGHSTASNGEHVYTVLFHEGKREVQRSLFLPSAEAFVLGADVVKNGGDA